MGTAVLSLREMPGVELGESKGKHMLSFKQAMLQNPTPIPSTLPCFLSLPIALRLLTHFIRFICFQSLILLDVDTPKGQGLFTAELYSMKAETQ